VCTGEIIIDQDGAIVGGDAGGAATLKPGNIFDGEIDCYDLRPGKNSECVHDALCFVTSFHVLFVSFVTRISSSIHAQQRRFADAASGQLHVRVTLEPGATGNESGGPRTLTPEQMQLIHQQMGGGGGGGGVQAMASGMQGLAVSGGAYAQAVPVGVGGAPVPVAYAQAGGAYLPQGGPVAGGAAPVAYAQGQQVQVAGGAYPPQAMQAAYGAPCTQGTPPVAYAQPVAGGAPVAYGQPVQAAPVPGGPIAYASAPASSNGPISYPPPQ
jgi:hypothetical protein